MAEVTLDSVPKKTKDLFNRGFSAIERGNLDYAIEMLTACVELEPGLTRAWKFLRAADLKKSKQKPMSAFSKGISSVSKGPALLKGMALLKSGKHKEAMLAAEKLLQVDPINIKYAKLFAEAAVAGGYPEPAIMTLEVTRDHNPDDIALLNWLGALYQKLGRTSSARECFERLCEIAPNDASAVKQLKDAMAVDSMSGDGWEKTAEEGGTYRDILKNKDEAAKLEQEAKSQKSDSDSDSLISDLVSKIENEPANMNFRRALAKLYIEKHQFDEGIAALNEAIAMNPGDPELERSVSVAKTKQFDHRILELRSAGDEDEATNIEHEKIQFEFDDLQGKIERYPNDLALRYDWGKTLFENDYFNEAIQQFQMAQRNPKNRVMSLYYLGLCFKEKEQYDMAMDQFKTASSEILIMDNSKKDVLYAQGEVSELMDKPEQASEFYKEIYQADIGYRDVAQKIELAYGG